jgi:hypothetical protein
MNKLKTFFVIIVVLIFVIYISTTDHLLSLKLLWIIFGLMLLLSLINYIESIQKIKSLYKFEIKITRGFVFSLASLPILYMLWGSRYIELVNRQLVVYWLSLMTAIFNFGIKSKT